MALDTFLDRLRTEPRWRGCIEEWRTIQARDAVTAPIPDGLDDRLIGALAQRGIDELYSHQAAAWDAISPG